jgi:hypothetical protein
LPDINNIRTPTRQPGFEGSNPAGYGALRDGAARPKNRFRQLAENRMLHKLLKWQILNQAGRAGEIKNPEAKREFQQYNQMQ